MIMTYLRIPAKSIHDKLRWGFKPKTFFEQHCIATRYNDPYLDIKPAWRVLLKHLHTNRSLTVLAARKLFSKTTTTLHYLVWKALTTPKINIAIAFNPLQFLDIFTTMKYLEETYPCFRGSEKTIRFHNGSSILFDSISNIVYSSFDIVWCDEVGHWNNSITVKKINSINAKRVLITSSACTISTQSSIEFMKILSKPEFKSIVLPWYLNPHVNKDWADKQRASFGEIYFDIDYNCRFRVPVPMPDVKIRSKAATLLVSR